MNGIRIEAANRFWKIAEVILLLIAIIGSAIWSYNKITNDLSSVQTSIDAIKENNNKFEQRTEQRLNMQDSKLNDVKADVDELKGKHGYLGNKSKSAK